MAPFLERLQDRVRSFSSRARQFAAGTSSFTSISYTWSRVTVDGYTETGGGFPSRSAARWMKHPKDASAWSAAWRWHERHAATARHHSTMDEVSLPTTRKQITTEADQRSGQRQRGRMPGWSVSAGKLLRLPGALPDSQAARHRERGGLVEQLFEEGLATLVGLGTIAAVLAPGRCGLRRLRRARGLRRGGVAGTSLDDLVEFTAIEPYTAALRAVVDLDALTLAHHERNGAYRARHSGTGIGHIHISNVHDSIRHQQSDQHRANLDAVRHRDHSK